MSLSTAKTLLATALGVALLAGCGGRTDDAPVGPDEPLPQQAPEGQPTAPATPTDGADAPPAGMAPEAPPREQRDLGEGGVEPAAPAPDAAADDGMDTSTAGDAEVVFGRWTVTGHRFGAVSALDENTAGQLHGRTLSFAADRVESGADECATPRYEVREANVLEFLLSEFRSSPMDLGLQVAADSQVTVVDTDCIDQPWTTLGSRVLLLPDGSALAPWDGAFFELSRGG